MSVWVQKLSEIWAYEKCPLMYLAIDLNWGHLMGAPEDNPYTMWSYFSIIDCNTHPKPFQRQLSFDSGYVFRDQKIFPKKSPKVRLYPSLTSTLNSILTPLNLKGFELIRCKIDQIASGIISRNASACKALREIFFGAKTEKKDENSIHQVIIAW